MNALIFRCLAVALAALATTSALAQRVTSTITGFNTPGPVAVDAATQHVYVGGGNNFNGGEVVIYDARSNQVNKHLSAGNGPISDVKIDTGLGHVYATNSYANTLVIIDEHTDTVVATLPTGKSPMNIAIDPATHRVYVACSGSSFANSQDAVVTVVDGMTQTVVGTLVGNAGDNTPSGVSVATDSSLSRVYYGALQPGNVTVLDSNTLTVTKTVATNGGLVTVAVNPATHKVYAANFSELSVAAIDSSTFAVTMVPAGRTIYALVANPVTNRIYVANAGDSTVTVIDGATDMALGTVPVGSLPHAIAVNTVTNKIYVPGRTSNDLTIIDGATNNTTKLAMGTFPDHVVVDETTNRIYVTNTNSNSLTVVDGGGAPPPPPPAAPVQVVEFYNAALDHYFITWVPDEIAALDAGTRIKGWVRTGKSFNAYSTAVAGASQVCRFYIPPAYGDSHFFGRGQQECDDTAAKFPQFDLEDPHFMYEFLPANGVCPANTVEVHRAFSNRHDANHRYFIDPAIGPQMQGLGWLLEGDGPDLVVMCAPA
jgi:YVTN family beta-propeller protein